MSGILEFPPILAFFAVTANACLSAALASGKNRSVPRWFLAGLFAPMIALAVICLARKLGDPSRGLTEPDGADPVPLVKPRRLGRLDRGPSRLGAFFGRKEPIPAARALHRNA